MFHYWHIYCKSKNEILLVTICKGWSWLVDFVFKDLSDLGFFISSDLVHLECIRFCFMQIFRNELHQVAEMLDQHPIASSMFGIAAAQEEDQTPCFFPHLLYTTLKTTKYLLELEEFIDESTMCLADCSEEFKEFALTVMNALGLHPPNGVNETLDVHVTLIKGVEKLS